MKKNQKKPVKRKTPKKSLLAPGIQNLRMLSEQIGEIIPATSFGKNGFCFQVIAHKLGLKKFWPKDGSKKERIYLFLRNVYKNHPKIFYKIFRENLPKGIERRHKQGNPVLFEETDQLNQTLKKLNIDLKKEIKGLNLPKERPAIIPPPFIFQKMIGDLALHPLLLPTCLNLFKEGHLNDAVRKSLEKYEVYVQKKSSLTDKIGANLMANSFNEANPLISIADTTTVRGKGLQDGFKFLSMGAMEFWRNFCSHGDEEQMPHQDALAILATISHLLNFIDNNSK